MMFGFKSTRKDDTEEATISLDDDSEDYALRAVTQSPAPSRGRRSSSRTSRRRQTSDEDDPNLARALRISAQESARTESKGWKEFSPESFMTPGHQLMHVSAPEQAEVAVDLRVVTPAPTIPKVDARRAQ